jgi:DNA-binding phage protein
LAANRRRASAEALGSIAKARGMSQMVKKTGLAQAVIDR